MIKIIFRLICLCLLSETICANKVANDDLKDEGINLIIDDGGPAKPNAAEPDSGCHFDIDPVNYFNTIKAIEDKYANDIIAFEKAIQPKRMDDEMLNAIVNTRGMSDQAVQENFGKINRIPAGLDMGGYCILRQQESILFFHRLKLRNSTDFKILFFKNDLKSLVLRVKMALNELNLHGTYERLMTDRIPTNLFYSPTFGKAELTMKDVEYKLEARYRMLSDRLIIETVVSAVRLSDAFLVTQDADGRSQSDPIKLDSYLIEDMLERMKTDLDSWIKDCFNDKLMSFNLADDDIVERFAKYEAEKTSAVNNYMQFLLSSLQDKILNLYMEAVSLPDFSIYFVDGMIFRIRNGVIRGLDTIYKRSVASAYSDSHNGTLRLLCGEVGFSNLQVSYKYEAVLVPGSPSITGLLILSARDLTALFSAAVMINPNSAEFIFQALKQMGPEALTIEGPANKVLGKFQHVIQNHVLALMTYSLNFHVRNLRTITDCEPNIIPYHEPGFEDGEKHEEKEHHASSSVENHDAVLRNKRKGKRKHKLQHSPSSDQQPENLHGSLTRIKHNWRTKPRLNKSNVKEASLDSVVVTSNTEILFKNKEERKRYYLLSGL